MAKRWYFVTARLLDELEDSGFLVDVKGDGVAGEEDLLQAFGDADDGDLVADAQRFQAFHGGVELSLCAVDDDELGQAFALVEQAAVAAGAPLPSWRRNHRGSLTVLMLKWR